MHDTLIIDFDGPLFDGRKVMFQSLDLTIREFSQLHSPPRDLTAIPLLAPTPLIKMVYAEAEIADDQLTAIADFYRDRLKEAESRLGIDRQILDWLDAMRSNRWALAVLTSRREESASDILIALGIRDWFDCIVGRDSGPAPKPSGDGVRHILDKLRKNADAAVMVGDSDSDYAAAVAAEVTYVHAGWSSEPASVPSSRPSCVLQTPGDLCDVLLQPDTVTLAPEGALPDQLRRAIAAGDLALFAGAGVSIPSGLGGWKDHYQPLLRKLGASWMAEGRELPDALQLICSTQDGDARLFDEFKGSFAGKLRPNSYHFSMLRAFARRIWTSNYDQLFERAIEIGGLDHRVVRNDRELLNNFASQRLVIKVNGDFESATFQRELDWGIVVTRQQFDRALRERPEIWRLFEDDFRNRSIVFVGVSFQDPILRQVTTLAAQRIPKTQYMHYLLSVVPRDVRDLALQIRESRNLERFQIRTLWFKEFNDVRRFVSMMSIVGRRPIVAVAGNTKTRGLEFGAETAQVTLPDGQLDATQLAAVSTAIGQMLARKGYRVTSGGAPYVGAEAVEAAFRVAPSMGRLYFRSGGGRNYRRLAPAIVVEDSSYDGMRKRFIGEASLLIAMGGNPVEGDGGGVEQEVNLAGELGVPVLLLPQFGGTIHSIRDSFLAKIDQFYGDRNLCAAIKDANAACADVKPDQLQQFVQRQLANPVQKILEALIESGVDSKALSDASASSVW